MSASRLKTARIPGSQLAQLLRDNKNTILQLWEEKVRKSLENAKSTDTLTLRNAIPPFLDRMADDIQWYDTGPLRPSAAATTAQLHGGQRAEVTEYSLEEVMREYFFLREVVFEVLESNQSISDGERDIILRNIESAIKNATTEFVRRQLEKIRAEESRYESLVKDGEEREQFISLLIHDLKNPLTAARLSAEVIERQEGQTSTQRALLFRIKENINRVERMISDLLDIGRIKSGRPLILKYEFCDLSETVQRVVNDYSLIYGNRFIVNGITSLQGYWAREGLRRVLENLLSNSVKHGAPGKPITVSLDASEEELCISVHNWGRPIPEKDQERIFQPYQKTMEVEHSGRLGWGLGLSQVKATVEAHHGKVFVESSIECGTKFSVQLPYSRLADLPKSA